ncbi:MAG: hypothetical protein QOG14_696 [Mycobacterium sp.]|jgi:hypothetical protein|nr:hypothetical protein [Mycobacterium sp.]
MRVRLRQVALVAADLAPVEAAIIEELGVELCYRDPDVGVFGLNNALFPSETSCSRWSHRCGQVQARAVSSTSARATAGTWLSSRSTISMR